MAMQLSDEHGCSLTRFSEEQEEMLHAPLSAAVIKQRPGAGGRALKYIKGDTAIDTANRIFGFGQWGYRVISRGHEVIEDDKKGKIEFYTADIELSVAGAAFPFPGDGMGIVTAPYTVETHEKARKEATTDALKRALRHYGDQFGLCLYDEDDYVDAGDGTLTQVKNVRPTAPATPRRVVDARQPQARIAAPGENTPATDEQKASIRKLCEHLSLPVPTTLGALNYAGAKRLITEFATKYKEQRQAQNELPLPLDKIPMVSQLRKQCDELFAPGKWDEVQAKLFDGQTFSDEEMTPDRCQRMHRSFEIVRERRATQQQSVEAKAS